MTYYTRDGDRIEGLDENGMLERPPVRTAHFTEIYDICDHKIPDWRSFTLSDWVSCMGTLEQSCINENDNKELNDMYKSQLLTFVHYCYKQSYNWLEYAVKYNNGRNELADMYRAVQKITARYLNLINHGVTPEYGMFPSFDKLRF